MIATFVRTLPFMSTKCENQCILKCGYFHIWNLYLLSYSFFFCGIYYLMSSLVFLPPLFVWLIRLNRSAAVLSVQLGVRKAAINAIFKLDSMHYFQLRLQIMAMMSSCSDLYSKLIVLDGSWSQCGWTHLSWGVWIIWCCLDDCYLKWSRKRWKFQLS